MIGAPLRDQIDELPIYGHANGPAVQRLRQHRIDHVVEAHLGFTAPLCLCLRQIPLWPQLVKRLLTIAAFNAHASERILDRKSGVWGRCVYDVVSLGGRWRLKKYNIK